MVIPSTKTLQAKSLRPSSGAGLNPTVNTKVRTEAAGTAQLNLEAAQSGLRSVCSLVVRLGISDPVAKTGSTQLQFSVQLGPHLAILR